MANGNGTSFFSGLAQGITQGYVRERDRRDQQRREQEGLAFEEKKFALQQQEADMQARMNQARLQQFEDERQTQEQATMRENITGEVMAELSDLPPLAGTVPTPEPSFGEKERIKADIADEQAQKDLARKKEFTQFQLGLGLGGPKAQEIPTGIELTKQVRTGSNALQSVLGSANKRSIARRHDSGEGVSIFAEASENAIKNGSTPEVELIKLRALDWAADFNSGDEGFVESSLISDFRDYVGARTTTTGLATADELTEIANGLGHSIAFDENTPRPDLEDIAKAYLDAGLSELDYQMLLEKLTEIRFQQSSDASLPGTEYPIARELRGAKEIIQGSPVPRAALGLVGLTPGVIQGVVQQGKRLVGGGAQQLGIPAPRSAAAKPGIPPNGNR